MPESAKPLEMRLVEWLESQGYPLEMKVATCFQNAGFSVSLSDFYKDPETAQSREIDVTSLRFTDSKNPIMVQFCCRIECKTTHDKPWISFIPQAQPDIPFPFNVIGSATVKTFLLNKMAEGDFNIKIKNGPLFTPRQVGYGVTQAFTTGQDVPYQAMMSAVKSSVARVTQVEELTKHSQGKHRYFAIVFPVIVIDAKLFECQLEDTGRVQVHEVDSSVIYWKGLDVSTLVHIVTKSRLEEFTNSVQKAANLLITIIEDNMNDLTKLIPRPVAIV